MQNFQQIMLQFITNPTEELLPQAKKLRQGLERGLVSNENVLKIDK